MEIRYNSNHETKESSVLEVTSKSPQEGEKRPLTTIVGKKALERTYFMLLRNFEKCNHVNEPQQECYGTGARSTG